MEELSLLHAQEEQFSADGYNYNDMGSSSFLKMFPDGIFDCKDDFKFLSDWEDQACSIEHSSCDDLDFECNLDIKTEPFDDDPIVNNRFPCTSLEAPLFLKTEPLEDIESPILNNALTYSPPRRNETSTPLSVVDKERILFPGDVEPLRVSSSIQTDNVLKRIVQARSVLINGEREIFGKNIIGLHSLNEIKTSPEENCQITSSVINGKLYKIIIRPKSTNRTKIEKPVEENSGASNIKTEPMDELISELQNGNYDVFGSDEMMDPWHLPLVGHSDVESPETDLAASLPEIESQVDEVSPSISEPRVPPLRIKIPKKMKKHKSKRESSRSVEEKESPQDHEKAEAPSTAQQTISLNTEMKSGPRMLEAASAINRKKLHSIVNSGDAVQLDHDYCSYMMRRDNASTSKAESMLIEKNPRKDSGLESGGVSDASEECHTPEERQPITLLAPELRSKLLEERRRSKDHQHVTKMAAALFRANNAFTSGSTKNKKAPAVKQSATSICDSKTTSETVESNTSTLEVPEERPKKKLKLEEYRSRRCDKDKGLLPTLEPKIEVNETVPAMQQQSLPTIDVKEEIADKDVPVAAPVVPECEETETAAHSISEISPPARSSPPKRRRSYDDAKRTTRRHRRSSSSASSTDSKSRVCMRSGSRDRRRITWSPSRRSSSRDSSSSSESSTHRRSYTSLRYHRRTRSRSRSPSYEKSRSRNRTSRRRSGSSRGVRKSVIRRSRSPAYNPREKLRQIEERRVIYVGRIAEGTTNHQLRQRFSVFGPIVDISVHFRERGDNYGFVTFAYKTDAYEAVEHGNDDPNLPCYDLCFGGRRSFCKQRYSDLDGMPTSYSGFIENKVRPRKESVDFDLLLKQAQEKIRQRKDGT